MKCITSILLVFTISFFAQTNKIEVVYKVNFIGNFLSEKNQQNAKLVENYRGIENALNAIKFCLFAQNGNSLYFAQKTLTKDNETMGQGMAKIFCSYETSYFRDLNNKKLIIATDFSTKKYFVNNVYESFGWQILTETKIVNGFLCIKAIGKDPNRSLPIEAWFCPKIPYQFGPAEYGNLPGLILELSYGRMSFEAITINFDSLNKIPIEIPTINLINQKDFDKIVQDASAKFMQEK